MKKYRISAPIPQGPAARDQQAFLIGMDFQEAAIRAGETHISPSGAPVVALYPAIVCYAFCAELYLKALTNRPHRGHRLNLLFRRLDQTIQDAIAAKYLAISGRDAAELDLDLREFSNAFQEWRYVFEGKGQQVHMNLLVAFVRAVYATIRNLRPEWDIGKYDEARMADDDGHSSINAMNLGGGTFIHATDGTGTLNLPSTR